MAYFSWYIVIKLMGHIRRDGVNDMLNIFADKILESNITPICLFVSIMMT